MMKKNENVPVEILLVEDNPDDAEITIRALKKNNVSNLIKHLRDGAEAIDYIFHEKDGIITTSVLPKLILLDLKMPRAGGIEVLKRLKGDDRTRSIPVVILTSSNEDPDVKKCYSLGANSYIVKPVGFDNFNKVISEIGMYWVLTNRVY